MIRVGVAALPTGILRTRAPARAAMLPVTAVRSRKRWNFVGYVEFNVLPG
jgi:hypothetical protein